MDLGEVELPDDVALPRRLLNQPTIGQHLERLAHGAAADLEFGAQGFFGEDALLAGSASAARAR